MPGRAPTRAYRCPMGFSGASSIVLALAVGLWLCYAVPIWLRRYNDVAVERNAIRLQQTIRALAETAEMPRELRVEATSRAVAEQRRALEQAEKAERRKVQLEAQAEQAASPAASLRRARLLSTGVLLVGLAAGVWGAVSAAWWVLGVGLALVAAAVAMLEQSRRVAARRRARLAEAAAAPRSAAADEAPIRVPQQLFHDDLVEAALEDAAQTAPAPAQASGWVPQPLPRPLYLDRDLAPGPDGGPDGGLPARREDPMAELLAAVRRSEQAIRAAHREAGVATFGAIDAITLDSDEPVLRPVARAAAASAGAGFPGRASRPAPVGEGSRWACMGLIEDVEPEFDDISEILRRRRAS